MARQPQFVKPILLYALPLSGLGLALITVHMIVPRNDVAMEPALAAIKAAKPVFGVATLAASYQMAIAAALLVAVCAASLWWCLNWIFTKGYQELAPIINKLIDLISAAPKAV